MRSARSESLGRIKERRVSRECVVIDEIDETPLTGHTLNLHLNETKIQTFL